MYISKVYVYMYMYTTKDIHILLKIYICMYISM